MTKEDASFEFRLKKIDETRKYLLEEIKHELMSKKHKKTCRNLDYVEHLLITYFSFNGYWLCFSFCICFISWYSCRC